MASLSVCMLFRRLTGEAVGVSGQRSVEAVSRKFPSVSGVILTEDIRGIN